MALIHSFEKSGNTLFRYRGQIPVILFILAVPVIYFTDNYFINQSVENLFSIVAVLISFCGLIIRAISIGTTPKGTSGRNTKEQVAESLNQTGIYSMVRHPLYLGNYLMWIGIVFFTYNIYFIVIVSLAFWLYYERIMFAEERFLERKFGEAYLKWSEQVPAFFPAFSKYKKGQIPFSMKSVLRREYSGFLATVLSFAFVDHLRYYFENDQFQWYRISTWCLAGSILLTLVLRTLKHATNLLSETDRS
ncbi:MAG: isoprenylcysteine carboxylmethyltransferase family protein [Bacteroidales bacterium]|nr:isoprenylcysteine carboxylmethyltransferase family protein [Bacteroidales bacterium]MCF8405676.1 isoprenylcysteine carboxylmethyltransferase family protein [Bacteroidales bacterium]